MDLPFTDGKGNAISVGKIGVCASCSEGRHEIAPEGVTPGIDVEIALTRSYLAQLEQVKASRSG